MYTRFPYCLTLKCVRQPVRHLSLAGTNCSKSHYDVLGLTPKATQSEVKAAYYELSKIYHPDKNQGGEDAADQFRDITNAYEILGNVKSRRLYDKGVRTESPLYRHPAEDDDPKTRFYRSREFRHKPPPPSGRQTVYDFDEWSRLHYGATFARDMERKKRAEFLHTMHKKDENEKRVERVVFAFIFLTGLMLLLAKEDYDIDKTVYDMDKLKTK